MDFPKERFFFDQKKSFLLAKHKSLDIYHQRVSTFLCILFRYIFCNNYTMLMLVQICIYIMQVLWTKLNFSCLPLCLKTSLPMLQPETKNLLFYALSILEILDHYGYLLSIYSTSVSDTVLADVRI